LTPPGRNIDSKFYEYTSRILWDWYAKTIDELQPIDLTICNGDAIDGKGERDGGIDQITTDRLEQCAIAEEAIRYTKAKKYILIRGTKYHVGKDENWEDVLADRLGAVVGNHLWIEHGGIIIDCKHRVSSSIIPHGRHTAPAREALWNTLHHEKGLQPNANILIRSHVHYYVHSGDAGKYVVTTPCLQVGSDYGDRICTGTIDLGFLVIDIDDQGGYTCRPKLIDMAFTAPQILHV